MNICHSQVETFHMVNQIQAQNFVVCSTLETTMMVGTQRQSPCEASVSFVVFAATVVVWNINFVLDSHKLLRVDELPHCCGVHTPCRSREEQPDCYSFFLAAIVVAAGCFFTSASFHAEYFFLTTKTVV
mmetsp:Transcript_2315/g.8632  ORF Transcript_2315/g.8632 Transcript_2315/m.8632 type:complete len:129 (+) Transcript_2315:335-721(+)